MGLSTHAQITQLPDNFTSGKIVWMVRAGTNYNSVTGSAIDDQKEVWNKNKLDGSFKRVFGPTLSVGLNKSIGHSPLYWGMELGAGMRGYKTEAIKNGSASVPSAGNWKSSGTITDKTTLYAFNAQLIPIMVGYKYLINDNIAIDVHVGGFGSYDFWGELKSEHSSRIYITSDHGNSNQSKDESNSINIGDLEKYRNYDFGVVAGAGIWYGHFNIDFQWQRGFISIFGNNSDMFCNSLQLRLGYAF